MKARENMLQAAYCAGIAFSRSYLAMSMPLPILWGGAKYGVPHGLANAVILPYFLEEYGPACYGKLDKIGKMHRYGTKTYQRPQSGSGLLSSG